jgi:hypothetical protein
MNRTGKIARLPYQTRQELNRRLLDNEPGDPLVAWLNARPEVHTVLTEQFDGSPITKQNLSEWRTGGFAVWELRQEIFGDALEAEEFSDELDAVTNSGLADKLCIVLAGCYASLLIHWDGEVSPAITQKLRVLHILCRDLTTLSRNAHAARKARIEREQEEDEFAFAAKAKAQPATGAATARRPMEPETGKAEGRVMNEELGKRPGTSDQSKPVAPGRTILRPEARGAGREAGDVATSCRHPETSAEPLPGMPNSILSKALKAAREKTVSGQPALEVLPDWVEAALVAPAAISPGKK